MDFSANIDSKTMPFPCPGCGQEFKETIGRLKNNPTLVCPGCGKATTINADELREGIAAVQKSFDDLRGSLGDLSK